MRHEVQQYLPVRDKTCLYHHQGQGMYSRTSRKLLMGHGKQVQEECGTKFNNTCRLETKPVCTTIRAKECTPEPQESCSWVMENKCKTLSVPSCSVDWEKRCTSDPI